MGHKIRWKLRGWRIIMAKKKRKNRKIFARKLDFYITQYLHIWGREKRYRPSQNKLLFFESSWKSIDGVINVRDSQSYKVDHFSQLSNLCGQAFIKIENLPKFGLFHEFRPAVCVSFIFHNSVLYITPLFASLCDHLPLFFFVAGIRK